MNRMMLPTIALLLLAAHPESDAALRDRSTLPPDVAQHTVYLSLLDCPPDEQEKLEKVLRFVIPSLSAGPYLAEQLPVRVRGTALLRLDLQGLGWSSTYPAVIGKHYVPHYRPDLVHAKAIPLVVSGLFFAATMLDPIEAPDAQYQLLYSGKPPTTADQFLKFWAIQNEPEYLFGLIEGQSGVAVQRTRLIENRPGAKRNYGWLTRDSRVVAGANDPLEALPNKVKFDAQEIIAANVKWHAGESGCVQAYFLATGDGKRQEKAPADTVVDHTGIRGVEILNSISCISCHDKGLNDPTTDAFREYITSGARVGFLKKDDQRNVDRYLTSDVSKEIASGQQQYADGIKLCNSLTPEANSQAFSQIVRLYHADVTLEQAAREVYVAPRELQLALADYSRRYTLSGPLALLAQGRPISRERFKANQSLLQTAVHQWNQIFAK